MLHIPRTRNENPLHVALNQTALEALLKVRRRGITSGRVSFSRRKLENHCEARGLGLTLHLGVLRLRTFTGTTCATMPSRLRQKGTKLEDITEALGLKSLMMSKRYAHLGPKGLHDVVAVLDEKPTVPKTVPDQVTAEGDKGITLVN
jgi:hypothetical protein